jgi:Ca2+-binding RTX toxin-like protein
MPLARSPFLSIALLLALPGLAHAGGAASIQGDTLVVSGTEGVDYVGVQVYPPTGELEVMQLGLDASLGPQIAGAGCKREDRTRTTGRTSIWCQPAGVTKVVVTLGAGNDQYAGLLPPGSPITRTVDVGAGDDIVHENYGGGTFRLGDGDDEAYARGPATFDAGAGDDTLLCQERNAETRLKAAFVLDGGLGEDRICGGLKDDRIDGGAADDKIFAGEGDDRIEGGSGDDQIEGGDDDDRIDAGRGEDEVEGGAGRDTIRARDRQEDDISCGSKRDTVFVDRTDLLNRCETIRR